MSGADRNAWKACLRRWTNAVNHSRALPFARGIKLDD
jgi:hypothetical protein